MVNNNRRVVTLNILKPIILASAFLNADSINAQNAVDLSDYEIDRYVCLVEGAQEDSYSALFNSKNFGLTYMVDEVTLDAYLNPSTLGLLKESFSILQDDEAVKLLDNLVNELETAHSALTSEHPQLHLCGLS